MTETQTRRRTAPPLPDLDTEEEVDLGQYWRALAARWWLVLLGLVVGLVLGYLVSLGSSQVWQASTTIYLGQPFSPSGGAPVQSLATNPRSVNDIVHSEFVVRAASRVSGIAPGKLRGGISTKSLSAGKGTAKAGTTQLVQITVQGGGGPRKVGTAANTLARLTVARLAPYPTTKIKTYEAKLAAENASIAALNGQITAQTAAIRHAAGISAIDRLFLASQLNNAVQQKTQAVEQQAETQQLLALAKQVEKPQVVEPAAARKTTARSSRNSMLVGAVLGLLIGALAALLWEPVTRRLRPRPV